MLKVSVGLRTSNAAAQRIRDVCRYIGQHSDEPLTIERLASLASMSRFYFARTFRAVTGVTPKEYVASSRLRALKTALKSSRRIDSAIYDAGYSSQSRVYEQSARRLGMTPGQYRRGGTGVAISYAVADTVLGRLMIGATDSGICFLQFGDSREGLLDELRKEYPNARIDSMLEPHPAFDAWVAAINQYLAGVQPSLELPLDIRATAFQLRVWKYLQSIPYGDVRSYAEVASAIGSPTAARAVARACASNVAALAIPCHRVVRSDGNLGGYRWGLHRKRVLLDMERARRRDSAS